MPHRTMLAAILMVLVACGNEPDLPQRPASKTREMGQYGPAAGVEPIGVMAHPVRRESISKYILSNTTLEAIREVTTYAKLNAIVEEIAVEEGDPVKPGEILLRLEDREIRNEHRQARIALDQARLAREQAQVKAQQAEANYQRALSLFEEELTSQQEFDQAVLANRTEELVFQNAEQQYEAASARLEAAEIQLSYTEIPSPIGGVIIDRLVNVGDRVNVNQAVFSVADLSVLWARIYVPEKELPQVRIGQVARLGIETYPDHQVEAVVKMISPGVDPTSGTFKVTLEVKEQDRLLRPGMYGTVRIATETRPGALVIPKKAVLRERDEDRVFVVGTDQTVQKRVVRLGFSDQDRVEVISGLAPGETVVTVGYEGLSDGYAVSVVGWEGSSQQATSPQTAKQDTVADSPEAPLLPGSGIQRRGPGTSAPAGAPERVAMLEQRLLRYPAIREEYELRLAEDPSLSTDPEKKMALLREMIQRVRRSRGVP